MDLSRLEQAFHKARRLQGAERRAFLAATSRADPALGRAVATLLEVETRAGRFLEPPYESAAPADWSGLRVGSVRLVRLLGAGGMGVVYEGYQERPPRPVAVKLMHPTFVTPGYVRRFERETEILARLKHPGIAQVYEAGTATLPPGVSVPYLVMELVSGARDLLRYVEEEGLELRERLRLFLKVCAAVHAAHLKGVIHRDLKPGNVLVDREGEPRVIDFGVARLADREAATLAGGLIGTLRYMSPEQAAGAPEGVDLRADVYALGVMLYELVCGGSPYPDLPGDPVAAARVILAGRPVPPRQFRRDLDRDLEAVLRKALEKEPERRYPSAAALGEDLERYLAGEPVTARPPGVWRQVRLFARRHRAFFAAAAVSVAALFAAAVVSTAFYLREGEARRRAAALFGEGRGFAHWVLFAHAEALAHRPGTTAARRALVDRLLAYLEGLVRHQGDDPELLRDVGRAYLQVGLLQGGPQFAHLGDRAGARRSFERAVEFFARLRRQYPEDPECRRDVLRARVLLAMLDLEEGRLRAVAARLPGLLEEARAVEDPVLTEDLLRLAGDLAAAERRWGAAASRYEAALQRVKRRLREESPDGAARIALVHARLAGVLMSRGERRRAAEHLREARRLYTRALTKAPQDPLYARNLESVRLREVDLLFLEDGREEIARGLRILTDVVKRRRARFDLEPEDATARRDLATALERLGLAHLRERAWREAARCFREVITLLDVQKKAPPTAALRMAWGRLGQALLFAGRRPEAAAAFRREYALAERLRSEHPSSPEASTAMAEACDDRGNLALARAQPDATLAAAYREALAWWRRSLRYYAELEKLGQLTPAEARVRDGIGKKIAAVERALRRLGEDRG